MPFSIPHKFTNKVKSKHQHRHRHRTINPVSNSYQLLQRPIGPSKDIISQNHNLVTRVKHPETRHHRSNLKEQSDSKRKESRIHTHHHHHYIYITNSVNESTDLPNNCAQASISRDLLGQHFSSLFSSLKKNHHYKSSELAVTRSASLVTNKTVPNFEFGHSFTKNNQKPKQDSPIQKFNLDPSFPLDWPNQQDSRHSDRYLLESEPLPNLDKSFSATVHPFPKFEFNKSPNFQFNLKSSKIDKKKESPGKFVPNFTWREDMNTECPSTDEVKKSTSVSHETENDLDFGTNFLNELYDSVVRTRDEVLQDILPHSMDLDVGEILNQLGSFRSQDLKNYHET